MRSADLDAVLALRFGAFFNGTGHTREADEQGLLRIIDEAGFEHAFVAEMDGAVVGSVLLVANELEPVHRLSPWLAGLVVTERCRGFGIGSALVRAVETRAASLSCPVLHLYTDDAEPFYARLGWIATDHFVQDGYSQVLMIRRFAVG